MSKLPDTINNETLFSKAVKTATNAFKTIGNAITGQPTTIEEVDSELTAIIIEANKIRDVYVGLTSNKTVAEDNVDKIKELTDRFAALKKRFDNLNEIKLDLIKTKKEEEESAIEQQNDDELKKIKEQRDRQINAIIKRKEETAAALAALKTLADQNNLLLVNPNTGNQVKTPGVRVAPGDAKTVGTTGGKRRSKKHSNKKKHSTKKKHSNKKMLDRKKKSHRR